MRPRLTAFGLAIVLDLVWGEPPPRLHPVVWIGTAVSALERRLPQSTPRERARSGWVLALTVPLVSALLAWAAARLARALGEPGTMVLHALLFKSTFAVRSLLDHAQQVRVSLGQEDLLAARRAAARMVSRDVGALSAPLIASAAVESLVENASDSAVAPWIWFAAGGLPCAAAYRAVNTLDAMVGYPHQAEFGRPSARIDDAANFVPARLTALFLALASARPAAALSGMLRDHGHTRSPNAGWPMAAAAHALGVRLEKQEHHVLHEAGQYPCHSDIARAERLVARTLCIAGLAVAALVVARSMLPRRP